MHRIRKSFEFWRPKLGLGDVPLTADQARKTLATFGIKFFKHCPQQLMAITHHKCPNVFQSYISDKWADPEEDAHTGRTFSLWAQDEYTPPITSSLPNTINNLASKHERQFGVLTRSQRAINSQHGLMLRELRKMRRQDPELLL